ncbi:hypothetical protein JR316_0003066 [Psilocybe cubensis]|nr:hypothetical protein JR316_0003066 [Psilocybe cubensis]KAH9483596.1 hypothetical protein JR316_0003066 [Psilocybe cubensis]
MCPKSAPNVCATAERRHDKRVTSARLCNDQKRRLAPTQQRGAPLAIDTEMDDTDGLDASGLFHPALDLSATAIVDGE